MRRRIYLLRHASVAYFEPDGRPVRPEAVSITSEGESQARATRDALAGVHFERAVTSGLPRALETARIVAPGVEREVWPDLRELEGGRLDDIPEEDIERAFTGVFRGVLSEETRFLGGETIESLFDRVLPALERLLADESWDVLLAVLHGGVNRAILSYALTGERSFLGNFEQAPACVNILDVSSDHWVVRAVNVTPYDLAHLSGRQTTMEQLYNEYLPYRKRQ
ncbi:MAG TPA: histidine phosphatase family protein [Gaiellaceae bacterium]|nr:histidine phosphatase family protein [Gaiellaceae bacterium]